MVCEVVCAGVEFIDQESHFSAVVLEVEVEVVANSAGSRVEENGREMFV